jgi:hypothetical protein
MTPPNPLHKPGYRLDIADEFDGDTLNTDLWLPYYLPHWSSRQRSATRYALADSALTLFTDADTQPWCPEFDGDVKCSSLQTGLYAGALGSPDGQHRFKPRCVVREAQPTQRLYTPLYGFFEVRVKAPALPNTVATLWMIGVEETPEESGEIAMFELFGDHITPAQSELRYGIHPWQDPTLTDEFYRETLPLDASDFHLYAIEWTPTHVDFYVDNQHLRRVGQSPRYPLQFMLGIYDLPTPDPRPTDTPKRFIIDYFRAYQPEGGYPAP